MKAVILAAGLGTRLRPLTDFVPKALVPVANRPALLRVADRLRAAGVETLCVNLHHHADLVRRCLDEAGQGEVYTAWEPEILGSGGGVAHFRDLLASDDLFLVHNCDVHSDLDLRALCARHRASGAAATLALVPHPPTDRVAVHEGQVVAFLDPGPGRLTYSGVAALSPEILRHLPPGRPSSLVDAFQALLDRGLPVVAHVQPGAHWWDLGTLASYLDLHRHLLQGWLVDPAATVLGTLKGWGCLGARSRVARGVELEDCVVWPDTPVDRGCRRAILGSFGIVRP